MNNLQLPKGDDTRSMEVRKERISQHEKEVPSSSAVIVGLICLIPVIYIAITDHLIGIIPPMMSIDPLTVPGLTTFGPLFILAIIVRPISGLLKLKGFLTKKDLVTIYVMTYVSTAVAMTLASTIVTSIMSLQERALYFAPHITRCLL